MIRIAAISDLHIWSHSQHGGAVEAGLNVRARECLDVLQRTIRSLRGHHLFILGDIFDRVRPEPQLLEATRDVLRTPGPESVTLLVGNHDRVSAHPSDHALGPLEWPDEVQVISAPEVLRIGNGNTSAEILCVPHLPVESQQRFINTLVTSNFAKAENAHRALFIHCGVYDQAFPKWAQESNAIPEPWLRQLCEKHSISVVLAGDWHSRKVWPGSVWIEQVGSLIPHSWADAGEDYGYCSTWNVEAKELEYKQISGPRFIEGDLAKALSLLGLGHSIYYREYVQAELVAERTRTLQVLTEGRFRAAEVFPTREVTGALTTSPSFHVNIDEAILRAAQQQDKTLATEIASRSVDYVRGAGL